MDSFKLDPLDPASGRGGWGEGLSRKDLHQVEASSPSTQPSPTKRGRGYSHKSKDQNPRLAPKVPRKSTPRPRRGGVQ